jgi:hypothetical protein
MLVALTIAAIAGWLCLFFLLLSGRRRVSLPGGLVTPAPGPPGAHTETLTVTVCQPVAPLGNGLAACGVWVCPVSSVART